MLASPTDDTPTLPEDVRRSIADCGFFPDLVAESALLALGDEPVLSHLVHYEATFMVEEVLRHLNLMLLTPTRLVICHTDEGKENPKNVMQALTSSESVPLSSITSVTLTRVINEPQSGDGTVVETWLSVGWGTLRRIELEPAGCADPACDADHGYTGTQVGDDITVRMSPAADGEESVQMLVRFGSALQRAVGGARR